ncbi:MAG: PIG-L family deacetylase, partial [Balneolaceae bacterium]
ISKTRYYLLMFFMILPVLLMAQPEVPVEEWTGKTILLVGAHPDDDASAHATLSMLQENGNDVYILILTLGNVGTRDLNMSRFKMAEVRRAEQLSAMQELGIPEENYINLGYTDGMLEVADQEEVVKQIVYWMRKLRPDVLFGFDPGWGYQMWHKTDHRMASYLAVDAARVAEWHLLHEGHMINDGLKPHTITEYMFFRPMTEAENYIVDISDYYDRKMSSISRYASQYLRSESIEYKGLQIEDLSGEKLENYRKSLQNRILDRDGVPVEVFRYYTGNPDNAGARR